MFSSILSDLLKHEKFTSVFFHFPSNAILVSFNLVDQLPDHIVGPLYSQSWSSSGFLLGHHDNREDGKGTDEETDQEHNCDGRGQCSAEPQQKPIDFLHYLTQIWTQ
jgi:hypothetical protein